MVKFGRVGPLASGTTSRVNSYWVGRVHIAPPCSDLLCFEKIEARKNNVRNCETERKFYMNHLCFTYLNEAV